MKNKYFILIVIASLIAISGCNSKPRGYSHVITERGVTNPQDKSVDHYTKFATGKFIRIDIDGVDCIIGAGNFDSAVAISCDWTNKDSTKKTYTNY